MAALNALGLSSDYGFVILAAASTFVMNVLHVMNTGKARKAAKVPYPNTYATTEQADSSHAHFVFNCAQRAHANFTENQPSTLGALLLSGLYYPRIAASLGLFWSINRYIYMVGYTARGPSGRMKGVGNSLASFGLMLLSIAVGVQMTGLVPGL